MNTYQTKKQETREKAQRWQSWASRNHYTYMEMARFQEYFSRQAKRYGLINEFRENAII